MRIELIDRSQQNWLLDLFASEQRERFNSTKHVA